MNRSLGYLLHPEAWVTSAVAPVKRGELLGVVPVNTPTVYLVNMFSLETGPLQPQLDKLDGIKYDSMEALVADGWEVD